MNSAMETLTPDEQEAYRSYSRKRYRNKVLGRKAVEMTDEEIAAYRKYDAAYQKLRYQRDDRLIERRKGQKRLKRMREKRQRIRALEKEVQELRSKLGEGE